MTKTYKDLVPQEIEYLKHIYYSEQSHKEKMEILCAKFDIGERTVRKWFLKFGLVKGKTELPPQLKRAQDRSLEKDTKVLLVTTAQNKTAINKDFLMNLKTYQDFIQTTLGKKTEIVIIPAKYRNPTSNIEDEKTKAQDWWEDEIEDYLFYGKVDFGDTLVSADSRISPTAKEPILGYELLANKGHLILGHSKIHFKTLPRLRGESLRCISTTGYLTSKNYSKSRAGEIGFEHHSYGFVIVELKDDDTCYIPRNVKVRSDGSFTDIIYSVENGLVNTITDSLGFIWGDMHIAVLNKEFYRKTIDLLSFLNPAKNVLHDIFDGAAINPHEVKDMFIQRRKIIEGKHLLENEVDECLDILAEIRGCCGEVYISEANHDNFLTRHIDNENWKKDLHNGHTYLKYAYIQQTVDLREYGNILGYLIHERFGDSVKYVKMGDSLKIADYECGLHGDFGTNGSKGQTVSFSRINRKLIHGHSHSAVIHNNVTCVGVTCDLEQYYNRKGFSSWAHAHSVVHNNGKNQLLVFGDDLTLTGLLPRK